MSDVLQSQARNNFCRVKVRTDKAHALRKFSSTISSEDDWDLLELSYTTQAQLLRDLLWHRDDVEIIGPDDIVINLRSALERIEALHG
jgi:predicted DNA-binding transcriptional regulator YafY